MATGAELTYPTATALQMANAIFGSGVTFTSAIHTGAANSAALYSKGQLSPGVEPSTTGVIFPIGNTRDYALSKCDPNRATGTSTDTTGPNNNAFFNTLAAAT